MALKGTGQFAQFATVYTGESLDIHNTSSTGEFSTGDEVLIYDSSLGENRKILRGNFFNGLEGDYISIHGTFEETTPATNMELLVYDPSVPANRRMTRANFLDGISAVGAFTDLTDTPASYSGATSQYVRVNATGTALEFATVDLDTLGAASSTTETQSIYVDKAATGGGTGVDWTNAFTTIQAAVDSLPAIINHAVTIYIRNGSTAYDEAITLQRVVAAGSITIRGEYYWYGTNASSKTGKIDLGGSDFGYADRAQIAAGDKIWLLKYSGTVEESDPSEYVVDTVASVNGAEITLTTNSGKSFDTSWTYQIVKTAISPSSGDALTMQFTDRVSIEGLSLNGGANVLRIISCRTIKAACVACYGTSSYRMVFRASTSDVPPGMYRCLIEIPSSGVGILVSTSSNITFNNLVIHSTASAEYVVYTTGVSFCTIQKGGIIPAGGLGVLCQFNSVVYLRKVLNNATVPKSPTSSEDASYII